MCSSDLPHIALALRRAAEGAAPHGERADRIDDPRALGGAILDRLDGALDFSLSRVHPGWIDALDARTRLSLTGGDRAAPRWARHALADRLGWIDPRHGWEARVGVVLEPAQLRLLPSEDLDLLLSGLGVEILACAAHGADRRALASIGRDLGPSLAPGFFEAAAARRPLSPEAIEVGRLGARSTSGARRGPAERLRRLGLFALACAAAGRHGADFIGVAAALPPDAGQRLTRLRRALPRGPAIPGIGDEFAALSLKRLQQLSARGLTRTPLHERRALLSPPRDQLPDERPQGGPS